MVNAKARPRPRKAKSGSRNRSSRRVWPHPGFNRVRPFTNRSAGAVSKPETRKNPMTDENSRRSRWRFMPHTIRNHHGVGERVARGQDLCGGSTYCRTARFQTAARTICWVERKATPPTVQETARAGAILSALRSVDEFYTAWTSANAHYGTRECAWTRRMHGGFSRFSLRWPPNSVIFALGSDMGLGSESPCSFLRNYGYGQPWAGGPFPCPRVAPAFDTAAGLQIVRNCSDKIRYRSVDAQTRGTQRMRFSPITFERHRPMVAMQSSRVARGECSASRNGFGRAGDDYAGIGDAFRILQGGEVAQTNGPGFASTIRSRSGIRERFAMAGRIAHEKEISGAKEVPERVGGESSTLANRTPSVCQPPGDRTENRCTGEDSSFPGKPWR